MFREKYTLLLFVVALVIPLGMVSAMSSTNYSVQSDSINFAGGLSTSSSYTIQDTLGELATGNSSSTNYIMKAGYQQMFQSYIAISISGATTSIPNISGFSGGSGIASTTWTVITDNSAGYSLSINSTQSPAMRGSNGDNIADYVPAGASPDFNFQLLQTQSLLAFNPLGIDVTAPYRNNGSVCGIGTSNTLYNCWDGLALTPKIIAQSSGANQPNGATTTAIYEVKIGTSKIQTSGNYAATVVVTAVTL